MKVLLVIVIGNVVVSIIVIISLSIAVAQVSQEYQRKIESLEKADSSKNYKINTIVVDNFIMVISYSYI